MDCIDQVQPIGIAVRTPYGPKLLWASVIW